MLSIHNNNVANLAYVPMKENLKALERAAEKLSTGLERVDAKDGAGELGLSDLITQKVKGIERLISGMENTMGFVSAQDDVFSNMSKILVRAAELAASALDSTKNTADRTALTTEYAQLASEMSDLATRTYNGRALFGTASTVSVRIGLVAATDIVTFSTVDLAGFSLGGGSISTVTHASAALVSIDARTNSLNVLRGRVGAYHNRAARMVSYTRKFIAVKEQVRDQLRNTDIARAAGDFTRHQVLLAASQSVLAQTNGLSQSALQFLQ